MNGPSDVAIQAALNVIPKPGTWMPPLDVVILAALDAAHDVVLGDERSVCLQDARQVATEE